MKCNYTLNVTMLRCECECYLYSSPRDSATVDNIVNSRPTYGMRIHHESSTRKPFTNWSLVYASGNNCINILYK